MPSEVPASTGPPPSPLYAAILFYSLPGLLSGAVVVFLPLPVCYLFLSPGVSLEETGACLARPPTLSCSYLVGGIG